jgi:DNA-binding PadR family transcriptional regulator
MNDQLQLEQVRKLLPLSEATYLILLALTEPQHGYGVMQTLSEWTEGAVKLGPGTLYGALNNLLNQKLIERAGEGVAGNERRKLYALTPLGRVTVELEHERLQTMVSIGHRILGRTKGA